MLNMKKIGQLQARFTLRFGDPTGTLVIDYPETARAALTGHPFMRHQSVERVVLTYANVRGGWERQQEQQEGLGRVDFRQGECWIYHATSQTDYATLRGQFAKEGCIVTWNGVRVHLDQILEDEYAGATVVQFTREEVS